MDEATASIDLETVSYLTTTMVVIISYVITTSQNLFKTETEPPEQLYRVQVSRQVILPAIDYMDILL